MNPIIVIPARLKSTRLPDKLLLSKNGHPLIWHTILQAEKTGLPVAVVTDSQKIFALVNPFCIPIMTGHHNSGTERIAEAMQQSFFGRYDFVVNWQGDEPEFPPRRVTELLTELEDAPIGTFATFATPEETDDPNTVKVSVDSNGDAVDFTRQPIPAYKHMGIYAYSTEFLKNFPSMEESPREKEENLEQLRWMDNGYKIKVKVIPESTVGIDTQEDYEDWKK
jgi:3-deoxy-manno-octulosonate cytidylyltransferase (CMP-KDO synthetase)